MDFMFINKNWKTFNQLHLQAASETNLLRLCPFPTFTLDVLFKSDSSLLSSFLQVFADCTEVVIFILAAGTTGHNFSFPPCKTQIIMIWNIYMLMFINVLSVFFVLFFFKLKK